MLHARWLLTFIVMLGIGGHLVAQNLLRNPGFEEVGTDGVPAGWERLCNPLLSAPLRMVDDAAEGQRAVRLTTEEWNFLRPQFVTQRIQIPAGAAWLRLSVQAKGIGLVHLGLRFEREGKPLAVREVDLGFGKEELPVEECFEYALTPVWREYAGEVAVPAEADAVLVKLGNTVGPFGRLNTWGDIRLDQAVLTVTAAPAAVAPAALAEKAPAAPADCRDVITQCVVLSTPPAFDLASLHDGDATTVARFMGGTDRAGAYELVFATPVAAARLDLALAGNVRELDVWADTDGDGVAESRLTSVPRIAGKGWLSVELPDRPVHRLRVQPIDGNLWGFRSSPAWCGELRLYVRNEDVAKAGSPAAASLALARRETLPTAWLRLAPVEMALPAVAQRQFQRMVCADLWMWGLYPNKPDAKLPADIAGNETFRRTVELLHRMGVDAVLIDLTNSSVWNLMPWPTKMGRGTEADFLTPLIAAIHAEGFKVYVELIHNISPFETIKWHYPQEETSRYPGMKQYPSILHGTHVRDNWLALMDEIMACGADGVGISSDEHYYRGAFMETLPADDPGRAIYQARFSHPVPATEEDSLAYRQWIQFRHESLGDLFGYWTKQLAGKYPGIYTSTMLMHWAHNFSYLEGTGMPIDVLGARSGITELGSDYMDAFGIATAAAANGWRRATMLHDGNLGSRNPDLHFYATTLWCWMYGAGSSNYWRFNYVVDKGSAAALARVYAMSDDLEALGAFDAKPPRRIALLFHRAAVDWWQVRAWWGTHDRADYDRGVEGLRGWYADLQTFYTLQQNGYPLDGYFLDHPAHLQQLAGYDVLVLPFAHSLSPEAVKAIEAAAGNGATIILVDGRQGETDGWGEPVARPALAALVAAGKAIVLESDVLAWGDTARFRQELLDAVNRALGDRRPLTLQRQGSRIDATVLEKADGARFVFLINHDEKPVSPGVGLALPEGNYEVFARDADRWYRGSVDGRTVLSAAELAAFRVNLDYQQPMILYIRPMAR